MLAFAIYLISIAPSIKSLLIILSLIIAVVTAVVSFFKTVELDKLTIIMKPLYVASFLALLSALIPEDERYMFAIVGIEAAETIVESERAQSVIDKVFDLANNKLTEMNSEFVDKTPETSIRGSQGDI